MPARNEERYLPRLIPTVEQAARRYRAGPLSIERILVDNASTDATASLGAAAGWRVVNEEKRVIAAVRNTGARAATGAWSSHSRASGARMASPSTPSNRRQ